MPHSRKITSPFFKNFFAVQPLPAYVGRTRPTLSGEPSSEQGRLDLGLKGLQLLPHIVELEAEDEFHPLGLGREPLDLEEADVFDEDGLGVEEFFFLGGVVHKQGQSTTSKGNVQNYFQKSSTPRFPSCICL